MFGHMGFAGFWIAVSTIALVLLVLWSVRARFPDFANDDRNTDSDVPMNLLRERFARGEIDREEFEERRSVLQGGRST